MGLALVLAAMLLGAAPAAAQSCRAPRTLLETVVGIKYCADPAFDAVVAAQMQRIRGDIRAARDAGRLVIYASTPISPRGGGVEKVNVEIAASVKARLEKTYGGGAWVLDPGVYQLPSVDGRAPGGADYMVMWTRVLAGDDGAGRDIDMAHFTGPTDMRAYFGCGGDDVTGCLARWLAGRAAGDGDLRRVADERRHAAPSSVTMRCVRPPRTRRAPMTSGTSSCGSIAGERWATRSPSSSTAGPCRRARSKPRSRPAMRCADG
jgi:hypothetical protein